ncbi:response regulator [Cumulibacter soli]|uniref:response regulator n=1 Tax=Cumulibacter soli TaxID=2546344 RepID=UPI001067CD2C|nr:response regulator transcription factor [Cumulibacter soli]
MTVSVLIVDDQELVRSGLRALLARSDDINVVGESGNGRDAVAQALTLLPDIILMDLRMPVLDGVAATGLIAQDERLSACRVIVLTTFDADADVFEALRAGASGFLLKDTSPQQLREAVRTVARGDGWLSPAVTERVMRAASAGGERAAREDLLASVTARERDVLREVGRGLSNDEIAEVLVISPATARTYVSRLLAKLGARDRSQLVVTAYESGLVRPC